MWSSSLFRWVVGLNIMYVTVVSYVAPTVTKAVGQNLSVSVIAGLGVAGTALSLGQAAVAKWVSPRVILYGGSLLGIPTGLLVLLGYGNTPLFAVLAIRAAWIMGSVVGENWHALQNEALAKEGSLSQMQTMVGSLCAASGLVGTGLVFLLPPSLETAILLAAGLELAGVPTSWITARKVLAKLAS